MSISIIYKQACPVNTESLIPGHTRAVGPLCLPQWNSPPLIDSVRVGTEAFEEYQAQKREATEDVE